MSVKQLRMQSLFGGYDQLTPGANEDMGYSDDDQGYNPSSPYTPGPTSSGLEQVGAQQDRDAVLGPDGRPLESNIKAPTVTPVGAPKGQTFQDYIQQMNEGYTPDYTSRDRLNKLLDAPPERTAPGWARALTAAALSVKAADPIKTAEQVMYAPYMRDVEEWKTRADPYLKSAELENRQNINERTLVSNAASAYGTSERNRIAQENNEAKNENVRQRNIIADYVARGAKQVSAPHSPTIIMKRPDGTTFDTGVPSGALSEAEAIRARGEWSVKASEAAGAGVYNDSSGAVSINPRTPNAPAVRVPGTTGPVTRPGSSTGNDSTDGPNALERGRIEQENIRKVMELDKGARKIIRPRGNNTYGMIPRPVPHEDTMWPGDHVPQEDADEWDRVKKLIDPSYVPPPPTIPRVGGNKGIGPSRVPNPNDQSVGMDGGNYAPEGKVPASSKAAKDASVASGESLYAVDASGKIVGVVPNTPAGRAEAARLGYKVRGR